MSKAFVRESDEEEDRPEEPPAPPVGFKNYMTPQGHRQLQEELRTLHRVERPKVVDVVSWAAGNGDRSENGDYIYGKRRLREIDRRIRFLSKRLEIAQVVDPAQQKNLDQVLLARPSPTLMSGERSKRSPSLAPTRPIPIVAK
jgi:transcription elongation factor GreB